MIVWIIYVFLIYISDKLHEKKKKRLKFGEN